MAKKKLPPSRRVNLLLPSELVAAIDAALAKERMEIGYPAFIRSLLALGLKQVEKQ